MKVRVKLFGILGQRFPGYHHEQGMDVEIPDGARVSDLRRHVELSVLNGCVVAVEGRIVKPTDVLENGTTVVVLQAGAGG